MFLIKFPVLNIKVVSKRIFKNIFLFLLFSSFFINVIPSARANTKKLQRIAANEAKKNGYDPENMKVIIDGNRTSSGSVIMIQNLNRNKQFYNEFQKILKRDPVVVIFTPVQKPGQFIEGGEFFVFLDKKTGEIIFTYKGK